MQDHETKASFGILLKQVGDSMEEGFVTHAFGRKGAGLFFLVFKSILPFNITNVFWIGIAVLTCSLFGLYDIPRTPVWQLGSLVAVCFGIGALYVDLRKMAKGGIHYDAPKA